MLPTFVPNPFKADGRPVLHPMLVWDGVHDHSVVNLNIEGFSGLKKIDLSPITSSTGDSFYIQNCANLEELDLSGLVSANGAGQIGITGNPALTVLNLQSLVSAGDIQINELGLTSLSFPSLESVVSQIAVSMLSALTALSAPVFSDAGSQILVQSNPVLQSVDLPALNSDSSINISDNPALATISITAFSIAGGLLTFSGNALSESCVNALLAQLVAINFIGTLDISGGTNSAPTGQGLTDVDTLTNAGATITTN